MLDISLHAQNRFLERFGPVQEGSIPQVLRALFGQARKLSKRQVRDLGIHTRSGSKPTEYYAAPHPSGDLVVLVVREGVVVSVLRKYDSAKLRESKKAPILPKGRRSDIFKVQVPIATNDPEPKALIYNEDRSVEEMFPVDDGILARMNGRLKVFFHGEVLDRTLHLYNEAPWQEW